MTFRQVLMQAPLGTKTFGHGPANSMCLSTGICRYKRLGAAILYAQGQEHAGTKVQAQLFSEQARPNTHV